MNDSMQIIENYEFLNVKIDSFFGSETFLKTLLTFKMTILIKNRASLFFGFEVVVIWTGLKQPKFMQLSTFIKLVWLQILRFTVEFADKNG